MIAVVDTGGANIASIVNAFERLERKSKLTRDPEEISRANHVILPGVGAAGTAMKQIHKAGLAPLVTSLKQPVLGICLGMQLLFRHSTEGNVDCLGLLDADVTKLDTDLPIPHMGWNELSNMDGPLFQAIPEKSQFYFVHSFAAPVGTWTRATCDYGTAFSASVQKDNFFGVQFHPERSSSAGQQLLRNFLCL
jgi:glutamine amidotransferase